jgi:tape measure domain-containing protein
MAASLKDLFIRLGYQVDESGAKKFQDGFKRMRESVIHVAEAVGAIELGKQILETAGAWQQAQVAFTQMLGSGQAATAMMEQLDKFAQNSPFSRDDIFQYSKQLLNFGFSAQEIMPIMQKLGNIAAGVGNQAMPGIVEALSRIKQHGVADMRSLQTMVSSGVPIVDALAKQFGVTNLQVYQMAQQGRIGFAAVNQALTNMTTGMGKFAGMQQKMANTLPGLLKQIKGRFEEVKTEIGLALVPVLQKALGAFNQLWDKNKEKIVVAIIKGFGYLAVTVAFVIGIFKRLYEQLDKNGTIDRFKDAFSKLGESLRKLTESEGFKKFLNWLTSEISDSLIAGLTTVASLLDVIAGLVQTLSGEPVDWKKIFTNLGNATIGRGMTKLGQTMGSVGGAANQLAGTVLNSISGGRVNGFASLSPGGGSTSYVNNFTVNCYVPPGTPESQAEFIRKAARDEFRRELMRAHADLAPQGG